MFSLYTSMFDKCEKNIFADFQIILTLSVFCFGILVSWTFFALYG